VKLYRFSSILSRTRLR